MTNAEVKEIEETDGKRYNVTLENIPESLHRSWKAMAALKGISMKEALVVALKKWVHDEASALPQDNKL